MKISVDRLKKLNLEKQLGLSRFKMPTIIAGAVLVFVLTNLLLTPISLRLDLSKGRAYTLTDSTKKIITKLDKPVKIVLYASSNVPAQLRSVKRDITDFLHEYQSTSSKIQIEVKDPDKDPAAQKEAQTAGLPQIPFRVYEQNKMQAVQGYFGIVITYDKATEVLPEITDIGSLEYNITSAIYKMTRKELPQVAMIGYDPAIIPGQDPIQTFRQIAGQQFTIVDPIEPGTPQENSEGTQTASSKLVLSNKYKTALIFDNNSKVYTDEELKQIEQFIKNGGNAVFFVSGVWVNEQMTASAANHKLFSLLQKYGVTLDKNILLSQSSELVNYGNQSMSIYIPYPMWLKTSDFVQNSSHFAGISQLMYLWSSSLNLKNANGYEVKPLVRSTDQSWSQTANFTIDPQSIQEPSQNQYKQYVVTAEATKKNVGRVTVIGSNRFLEDRYLSRNSNNLEFVLNVLNDYASGGALQGIRQRQINLYPLPELNDAGKEGFKYVNMLLLPGLFALYGVVRLMKRAKKD